MPPSKAKKVPPVPPAPKSKTPQPSDLIQTSQALSCQLCKAVGHLAPECPWFQARLSPLCTNCSRSGHKTFACPEKGFCTYCDKYGHILEKCWTAGTPRLSRTRGSNRGYVHCDGNAQVRPTPYARQQNGPQHRFQILQRRRDDRCYKCGNAGHFSRDCTKLIESKNNLPAISDRPVQSASVDPVPSLSEDRIWKVTVTFCQDFGVSGREISVSTPWAMPSASGSRD